MQQTIVKNKLGRSVKSATLTVTQMIRLPKHLVSRNIKGKAYLIHFGLPRS